MLYTNDLDRIGLLLKNGNLLEFYDEIADAGFKCPSLALGVVTGRWCRTLPESALIFS